MRVNPLNLSSCAIRPVIIAIVAALMFSWALAQNFDRPPRRDQFPPPGSNNRPPNGPPEFDGPPPFRPGGPPPGGGPGGRGIVQEKLKLVKQFDKDGDNRLNAAERKAAREFLARDFADEDQRLGGYRTLNLLNSHEDPTFLRSVLYYQIARDFIPAPKANYVCLVINGESWGIYVNAQQFNKDLVKDFFGTTKGARWKVPGSPRASGGLAYGCDDVASLKRPSEISSTDDPKTWRALIRLCRELNQTPPDKLEAALEPLPDIDAALQFLALENAFINDDGYWIRTSDYNIYQDEKNRFHIIPHDANETFREPEGPGRPVGAPM